MSSSVFILASSRAEVMHITRPWFWKLSSVTVPLFSNAAWCSVGSARASMAARSPCMTVNSALGVLGGGTPTMDMALLTWFRFCVATFQVLTMWAAVSLTMNRISLPVGKTSQTILEYSTEDSTDSVQMLLLIECKLGEMSRANWGEGVNGGGEKRLLEDCKGG